jgi:dTDP-glucose 4,6-dehydratase
MKLLVTGGAGFIGSNFILYWLKKYPQDFVVNLDKLTYAGNLENLTSVQDNPNYKFIQGDICSLQVVSEVMQGVDTVVHFAAESHVDRSITDPASFVKTNVLGTQVLLGAALENKVKRFHHISTDEVYGSLNLDDKNIFNERTLYDPRSPYSASKAGSDHLVKAYYHTYNLPITISNCSNNFGPYQFPEKLIALAITNLLEGKKVPVYGDGLYVRDWLYVEDHCRAIDLILEKGKIGETYCVGGLTENLSNISILQKIIKLLGKTDESLEYVKDRPGHDRRYALDWSKIKSELGWEPLRDFDEWLEKTVNWYQENKQWWKNIKSGEYKEYYKKQYAKL